MNRSTLMWCAGVAIALLGCGGGGGGTDAAAPTQAPVEYVPAAASKDTATFAGWMKQMSTESMEGRDSMDTTTFTPAVQDDADPVAAPL